MCKGTDVGPVVAWRARDVGGDAEPCLARINGGRTFLQPVILVVVERETDFIFERAVHDAVGERGGQWSHWA